MRQTGRNRYPVRLRLSEAETVRGSFKETQKHRFINKCYIIFYFHSDLGTILRAAIMQRYVDFCFSFTLLEELITSGVAIHPEKTKN